jgi:hypothetical protein
MAPSELFDIRKDLWTRSFEKALPFDQFVASGAVAHQERWMGYAEKVSLSAIQRGTAGEFKRRMYILVLAGTWCGDCARQCPMIEAIGKASSALEVRYLDNQADSQLRDELRIHGAARVPVAVTLSEDFFEVGRSLDRTLAAYNRKAKTELGDACDAGIVAPSAEELAAELGEWFQHFERQQLLLRVSPFLRKRHSD